MSQLEDKLARIMSKDKSLVRRVSDIEVEEITLTKKGAIGDEADAVLLFKEQVETEDALSENSEDEVVDEVPDDVAEEVTEEVADLAKEEPTFEDAISLMKSDTLTDEQKEQIVDLALSFAQPADLEKDETVDSVFPEEAMSLLKSINDTVQSLVTSKEDIEIEPEVELTKQEPEEPLLHKVGSILRKAQEERKAQGRAKQDADFVGGVTSLSRSLKELSDNIEKTKRSLNRACGQDA